MKNVGVALGGGGARGLAHILALETIDACGIRPTVLSGTSMGAIIGALYASGQSGAEIRQGIEKYRITKNDSVKDIIEKTPNFLKWLSLVSVEMKRGGLIKADGFFKHLFSEIGVTTFEELKIPFHVVTTDFWTGKEVIFNSGELLPAIKASMAIPGVFAPVVINDQVLVDGGMVNNVPFDILADKCSISIAINVAPARAPKSKKVPNVMDSVVGMFDMLVENIVQNKMKESMPSIYVHPEIKGIKVLDFDKIKSVYAQSESTMQQLKVQLEELKI